MDKLNAEAGQDTLSEDSSTQKVRKVIQEVCTSAGATVAIQERVGDEKNQPGRRHLQVTYTGERPMPYPQWFKLVDSIDAALDPSGLIDWEFSELSEENEDERMAAWAILPAAE
ncbi:MAG: hypothetical protein ABSF29_00750 [Tepidisphaeraceae bacterium]|jgi:hypothetical protein